MLSPIPTTNEHQPFYRLSLNEDDKSYELMAIFQENLEGGYSVYVPEILDCSCQGDTFEEALSQIRKSIYKTIHQSSEYLDSLTQTTEYQRKFAIPLKITI